MVKYAYKIGGIVYFNKKSLAVAKTELKNRLKSLNMDADSVSTMIFSYIEELEH